MVSLIDPSDGYAATFPFRDGKIGGQRLTVTGSFPAIANCALRIAH